jgi:hypothetical protein
MAGKTITPNARTPQQLAPLINRERELSEAAGLTFLEHGLRCGALLNEAKEQVGHGEWLPWLEANYGGKPRHAQNYMRLAANAQSLRFSPGEGHTLSAALKQLAAPKAPTTPPVAWSYMEELVKDIGHLSTLPTPEIESIEYGGRVEVWEEWLPDMLKIYGEDLESHPRCTLDIMDMSFEVYLTEERRLYMHGIERRFGLRGDDISTNPWGWDSLERWNELWHEAITQSLMKSDGVTRAQAEAEVDASREKHLRSIVQAVGEVVQRPAVRDD